jgi:hypothetical protein
MRSVIPGSSRRRLQLLHSNCTEQTRFRTHSQDSFLLGSVCNVCNNERLNALEGEVAPTLKGLIPGASTSIPNKSLSTFSLWALKTAFVLTSFLNTPVGNVPLRHGRHVIGRQGRLPRGVAVFHRQTPHWRIFFSVANSWVVEVPTNIVHARSTSKSHRRTLFDRWPAARVVPQ